LRYAIGVKRFDKFFVIDRDEKRIYIKYVSDKSMRAAFNEVSVEYNIKRISLIAYRLAICDKPFVLSALYHL